MVMKKVKQNGDQTMKQETKKGREIRTWTSNGYSIKW